MDILTTVAGWATALVTGFVTWYFTNKKTKSQQRGEDIENNKSEIETLKLAFELQTEQYKSLLALKDEKISNVMDAIKNLTEKVNQCEVEIKSLKETISSKDKRIVKILKCAEKCTNRKKTEICPVLKEGDAII